MINLNPTLTADGLKLFAGQQPGFNVVITHVAFGGQKYDPSGYESALKQELARFPIDGSALISPSSIQVGVLMKNAAPDGKSANDKWIGEIGFYAGNTLFAVLSQAAAYLFYKSPNIDIPVTYVLDFSVLPPGSITVNNDALSASIALASSYAQTAAKTSLDAQKYITSSYYGALAVAPAARPDGTARQKGDRYFDTTANAEKTWNGGAWYIPNIDSADLATPGGATLIGFGGRTVADKLADQIHANDRATPDVARAAAVAAKVPFQSEEEVALPGLRQKIFSDTYGFGNSAATLSIMTTPGGVEVQTQALGFGDHSDVSVYADRDSVTLIAHHISSKVVAVTTSTTFTATTVTSPAFTSGVLAQVRLNMLIDVHGQNPAAPKWTGVVTGISADTIQVSNWYIVDKSRNFSTPPNGAQAIVNPCTKKFPANIVLQINPDDPADAGTSLELDIICNKLGIANRVRGLDIAGLGTERTRAGITVRDNIERAIEALGLLYGLYVEGGGTALYSVGSNYGVNIEDAVTKAITIRAGGKEKFGIGPDGSISTVHLGRQELAGSGTVADNVSLVLISANGATVTLPNPAQNDKKTIRIRSFGNNTLATSAGDIDEAGTTKAIGPTFMGTFHAWNGHWYQIG